MGVAASPPGRNLLAPAPSSTPNTPTLPTIHFLSSSLGIQPDPGRMVVGLLQSPVNRGLPGSATPKMWGDATSKGYSTSSSSPVSDITPLMEPLAFVPMLVSGFRRFLTVLTPCLATILLTFGRLGSHSMVLARRSGRAMCRVCRPAAFRPPFRAAVPTPRAKLMAPYGHPKTYTLSTKASDPNSRHSRPVIWLPPALPGCLMSDSLIRVLAPGTTLTQGLARAHKVGSPVW